MVSGAVFTKRKRNKSSGLIPSASPNEIPVSSRQHGASSEISHKGSLATSSAAPVKNATRSRSGEQRRPKSWDAHDILMPGAPQIPEPRAEEQRGLH